MGQLQASFVPNVESTRWAVLYVKQCLMGKASFVILGHTYVIDEIGFFKTKVDLRNALEMPSLH